MAYSKTLKIDEILKKLPDSSGYLVAYSGGSDSTALLHLFSTVENVRAIHINHGLNADANLWQSHCQRTCDNLNIPLITETYDLPDSSENTCRKARYESFKKHINPNEILLTAHHAGDQAETILLKLLRGSGLSGISGMREISSFHHGKLARVLLNYTADDLKQNLIDQDIKWIEDDSNQDNSYRRNFLRNEIIPALDTQVTNAVGNICRTGENIYNSEELLNYYLNFNNEHLNIEQLKSVPSHLQSTLLYHWLSSKNLPVPDKKAFVQLCHDFCESGTDKNPHYGNKYFQLVRWKQAIYCLKNYELIKPDLTFQWNTNTAFVLPNYCGEVQFKGNQSINLVIKFNQVGQKLKPINSKHTKTVKNLFQQNNVSTWDKHNTPFVYYKDQLISLGNDWSAVNEMGLQIKFKPAYIII